ncbi:MAG: Flp pilus assembly complex ATPase component TadA [Myxococcales bacterium]|nr:Flp pilus assembly complex ATPase component TadA [Myxococcales bacterium]
MPFSVILTEKGGATQRLDFESEEITIGRVDENDICLPKGNISKKHTKIVVKDGKIIVLDLKSTNGTYVNGKKLAGPQVISPTDKVYIGDFILNVEPPDMEPADDTAPEDDGESSTMAPRIPAEDERTDHPEYDGEDATRREGYPEEPPGEEEALPEAEPEPEGPPPDEEARIPTPAPVRKSVAATQPSPKPSPMRIAPPPPAGGRSALAGAKAQAAAAAKQAPLKAVPGKKKSADASEEYAETLNLVHDRLIEALDLRRLDLDALGSEELWKKTEATIRAIVNKMDATGELDAHLEREELIQDVLNEALGLGPLEIYLADEGVSEIMVNSPTQVYVERDGKLMRVDKAFSSAQAVLGVIERIVAPLGRHIDESSPLVDARLADGSRVNAIIPPLALKGPCITIRKFKRDLLTSDNLIEFGTLTPQMAEFLDTCVKVRRNIVISGGTGSGKTTLLNILSSYIPERERIVTIEDAAELQLPQDHVVSLEARPSNIEGKGQITIRDLVRNSLRMRPDRIVIGECRGGEALDMLQAMNTGHDGSLTTLHANTPRDALSRLETMVLMSGMELPVRAIRDQIASAVNLIIQQTRFADGTRKVTAISEVSGMEMDVITMQDIFTFKQEGFDEDGKVVGKFVATGFVPKFYDDLQRRGIPVNMDIFREEA